MSGDSMALFIFENSQVCVSFEANAKVELQSVINSKKKKKKRIAFRHFKEKANN